MDNVDESFVENVAVRTTPASPEDKWVVVKRSPTVADGWTFSVRAPQESKYLHAQDEVQASLPQGFMGQFDALARQR